MGTRIRAVLSVGAIAVCVGLAASACSSGSTAGVETASSSASASPAFPVESLPPGVEKDSVQDLNSTKDMTGVVTTVPFGQSPYAAHLPDVCDFVPENYLSQFGLLSKKRGFKGTQLVVQSCVMQGPGASGPDYSSSVSFYTNNIDEILEPSKVELLQKDVKLSSRVSGFVEKDRPFGPDDTASIRTCGTAWGTFFGAIVVDFRSDTPSIPDPCAKSLDAAKFLVDGMPKSPSQMRAAP